MSNYQEASKLANVKAHAIYDDLICQGYPEDIAQHNSQKVYEKDMKAKGFKLHN